MNNKILDQYNIYANRLVARILRYGILLMALVGIASDVKIFIINVHVMRAIVLLTCVIYLIPTILFDGLKINKLWAEFLVLALIVLTSGMMYTFLSYHVVMTFIIPVCIACLYNGKRYPIFTTVISIPVIIAAHFIAFELKIVPDEPLVTRHGVIFYGILPRIIQFIGCALICIGVAGRTKKLILNLLTLNEKQFLYEAVLHKVITESEELISARNYREVTLQAARSVVAVLESLLEKSMPDVKWMSGYCVEENRNLFCIYTYEVENHCERMLNKEQLLDEIPELQAIESSRQDIWLEKQQMIMIFRYQDQVLGFIVIQIEIKSSMELMDILRIMHTQIEKSIINIRLNTQMIKTQRQVIESLAEVCESKSKQTGQHIKRVSEYMRIMGEEMGLDEQQRDHLAMAAMLHDVGKLKVPDSILEKPGKLTEEEFEQIKQHVHVGKQLLENCNGEVMELGKIIAFQHHEKWDGTGYLKMKGEEIHKYARLVAIIDVFDALVSTRSYKKAWTPEAAYEEIVSHRETHFSPEAVDLFIKTYPKLIQVLEIYPD